MSLIVGAKEIKEKILRNVSGALREIHRISTENQEENNVLTNDDWQVHCLLEHLDFALLFGLRLVPDGYYRCAKEFTDRELREQIDSLLNVATNLGRGRAWFFHAFNENLTESYIRSFQYNQDLMKKFYTTDSIVFDHQRLNTLITLCSGLENVRFQLKTDCPHFDRECWPAYFQTNCNESTETFPTLTRYFSRYSNDHIPIWLSADERRRVASRPTRLPKMIKQSSTISSIATSVISSEVVVESSSPSSSISFDNPTIEDSTQIDTVQNFSIPTPLTPEFSSSLGELDPIFHPRIRTPSPIPADLPNEHPFETPSTPEEKVQTEIPAKTPIETFLQSNIEETTQIEPDVNLQLQFNLEIFEDPQETLNNFFPCSIGHNNGNIERVYFLITTLNVYLIKRLPLVNGNSPIEKIETIRFEDIDYIEVGPFEQFFRLISYKNRKLQKVTTSSADLTKAIYQAIQTACQYACISIPKVLPATMQELSIKKELAKDMKISNAQNISLIDYHLVFWEEPQMSGRKLRKEGKVLVKILDKSIHKHLISPSSQRQQIAQFESWHEAYVTLKVERLNIYLKQSDAKPVLSYTLADENCQGCRRSRAAGIEHGLEIILGNDSTLCFDAKTKTEQDQWVNAIMQGLSQGRIAMNEDGSNVNTIPCSLMLTDSKIYFCHDENDNALIRQLESTKIDHIEKVFIDMESPYYCVLTIEQTHQDSKTWIIYFLFTSEMIRFVKNLQGVLSNIFQVSFDIDPISDPAFQAECQQTLAQLRNLYSPTELTSN